MAEAGANPGPVLDLEDEAKQLKLRSTPEVVVKEDKLDGVVGLVNVSLTLSGNNLIVRESPGPSQPSPRQQQPRWVQLVLTLLEILSLRCAC